MEHPRRTFLPLILSILILTPTLKLSVAQTHESASSGTASKPSQSAAARLSSTYGKLPLSFERNEGQTDGSVQFLARQAGYTLFLTPGEAVLSLHSGPARATKPGIPPDGEPPATPLTDVVRMELIGANTEAQVAGVDPLPGKSNYFIGNDPSKWHTDVPTYAKVRYQSIYPGIDLLYYGNQDGRLEHDFVVSPGADPNAIVLSMRGSDGAVSEQNGQRVLRTKAGSLTMQNPVAYQEVSGERKAVPATYIMAANNQIRFQVGSYDKSEPLVIDPVIEYTAVWGGLDGNSLGLAVAVDASENAYVTGNTTSTDFPVVNAFEGSWDEGPSGDYTAFVSKINAAGTALLYSTYLNCGDGCGATDGLAIGVDKDGRAYVTGYTGPGFPVKNAYQPTYGGGVFLTAFSPEGDSLVYSTYLGGGGASIAFAIVVDESGDAFITGTTGGPFPTLHSVQTSGPVFVAKFNSSGVLQYSSVFGPGGVSTSAIAVDASGSVYVAGDAGSLPASASRDAFEKTCPNGVYFPCGFVAKLSPSGENLDYATFIGGSLSVPLPQTLFIAVDSSGDAYVAGSTRKGFPIKGNSFQKTFGGGDYDIFVAKLNSSGSDLIWSTYLGGKGNDTITNLAIDQYRTVYVAGYTTSPNFPLKAPIQGSSPAGFVTTLSGSLSSIVYYSTYVGANTTSIAVDKQLNVYVTGNTVGAPKATPGAFSQSSSGVFVSKLVIMDDLALALSASPNPVATGGLLTYTIAVTSKGPDFATNLQVTDTLPAGTTFVSDSAGGGSCTAPAVGGTGTLHCVLPQLNKGSTYTVTLTVMVNAVSGSTLSNTATTISNTQDFTPANNTGTITTSVN